MSGPWNFSRSDHRNRVATFEDDRGNADTLNRGRYRNTISDFLRSDLLEEMRKTKRFFVPAG